MTECKESEMLPGVVAENPLELICTKDKKGKGYTGYIACLPSLTAQGQTKSELASNLLSAIIDIYKPILAGNE